MHCKRVLSIALTVCAQLASSARVAYEKHWNLTSDIQGSVRLNGLAFQQNTIKTHGEHQYVAFYKTSEAGYGKHHVSLGRRRVLPDVNEWEYLTLTDYTQTTFDEHNTISMGISGDGRIHLSFDHHDVPLNYRISNTGIANDIPSNWTASLFGPTQNSLPGSEGPWTPLTYPRFESLPNGDLLLEFRIGQSGSGDSWIHRYSSTTGQWSNIGKYLQGENNNAYINGLTSSFLHQSGNSSRLFASWTVRETPDPSTNHDFYFAYSDDDGVSWKNTNGSVVAKPITPSTEGILVYAIPEGSQIINQEAQCVDAQGRFHALMRDNSSGEAEFYHYMRTNDGVWSKKAITVPDFSAPPYLAYRGKILSDATGEYLIAVLPDQPKQDIKIYVSTAGGGFEDWELLATVPNSAGEPLVDETRLRETGVLSLFVRQGGAWPERMVQIWDFGVEF